MKALTMFSGVVLAAMAVACGESAESESTSRVSGSMTVHGTVSTRLSVDNARAVAIGTDGRTFWAYLDQDREFTLDLPVGQSYRVIVANQRSGGGQQTIGHLTLNGSSGRTEWIGANRAINVDLGLLRLAGTASSTGVKPSCACSDDDYDDAKGGKHDDDYPTKDGSGGKGTGSKDTGSKGSADDGYGDKGSAEDADESDKGSADPDDCNVCTDKSVDKELEPSKKPSGCEDKDADKHADKDDSEKYGDKKPCSGDSGSAGKDTGSKDGSDSDAKGGSDSGGKDTGAPSKDGSSSGSGGKTSDSGSKSEGSKCNASTECTSTCSCVASTCSAKK